MFTRFSMCSIIAATMLTTGCTPADEADPYRDAIPDADALSIKLPGDEAATGAADGVGQSQEALLGETAMLYLFTRDISRTVNGTARAWLNAIEDITEYPPTTIEDGKATWGPHTPALSLITFMFVVEKDGDTYRYALTGKVKNEGDESYVTLISGENTPTADTQHHAGSLMIDIDAVRTLDPSDDDAGRVTFVYATASSEWNLDVTFDGFVSETGEDPVDAQYHYREQSDQSGDFVFAANSDLDDDGSAAEVWNVRSRWVSGGSGRSDVDIEGGDLGDNVKVSVSECWNDVFQRTYFHANPEDIMGPGEGDPSTCVFEGVAGE